MCDLAETYHIYEYWTLPPFVVASFSIGLKDNSRIKMKLSGQKYPLETILLASAVDRLGLLLWIRTKDAEKGKNRPASILEQLLGEKKEKEFETFTSIEEFEKALAEIEKKEV